VVTDKAAVQADSRELATLAARIASEKQADAILVLDVRELITITDYFVIASGASERQVKTVTDEIVDGLKGRGVRPVRQEGEPGTGWLLIDYVDFVVHIFTREERQYYRLENLWRDAPTVDWEQEPEASSG
jgi:ribosome-associated protein